MRHLNDDPLPDGVYDEPDDRRNRPHGHASTRTRVVSLSTPSTASLLRSMPIWPLAATLAVQTLATMALYSLPAVAPEVARDLHVSGTLVGDFVATAYGVGILSALVSPGLVRKYGGVRATQAVLLAAAGMLAFAALGSGVTGLALAAVVLGLGYGAAAPASTHLLVPQTPQPVFNLVMSLRQIGVPLGGVLAALILPPLVLAIGWRAALLTELGPVLLLIALMEIPRKRWDIDREPNRRVFGRALWQPFILLREQRFRRLSVAALVYAGLALCLVAFMTVQLTTVVDLSLVQAGQILAVYQIAGSVSRPIWGWIADRFLTPAQTLAVLGAGMAATALVTGLYGPGWPIWAIMANALLAGCTAGGYTGVAYAEYATLGGRRRTEATGLGTAIFFTGGMAVPPIFGAAVAALDGYRGSYWVGAVCALVCAVLLVLPASRGRVGRGRSDRLH
jgi:MFS family permease